MKKVIIVTGLLLTLSILGVIACGGEEFDGNTWKKMNELSKSSYCKGVGDGNVLVYNAMVEGVVDILDGAKENVTELEKHASKSQADTDILELQYSFANLVIALIHKNFQELLLIRVEHEFDFGDVTIGQIKDGIDVFYEDFRNRKIKMIDAIYIVKMQINGENPEIIEAQARYLRMIPNVEKITDAGCKKVVEQILKDKDYQTLVKKLCCYFVWDTSIEEQIVKTFSDVKKVDNCQRAIKRALDKGWISRDDFIKSGYYCAEDGNCQALFCYGDYESK